MKIEIKKSTQHQYEYKLTREDKSVEIISLETKTFLVHDVCHYVVEKNLNYTKGFWGMLAQGYSFKELFGKDNMNTTELRFIEQVVGPVQSCYLGNIKRENFELFVQHIDFTVPPEILDNCLAEIDAILKRWKKVTIGEVLMLEW